MQAEVLVTDGEVRAPCDQRDAGKSDANAGGDHRDKRGNAEQPPDRHDFRTRAAGRFVYPKKSRARENAGDRHAEESFLPAISRANDATESLAGRAAKQHAGRENGLREGAALLGECAGNHGLSRGRVSGFAEPDDGARNPKGMLPTASTTSRRVCSEPSSASVTWR